MDSFLSPAVRFGELLRQYPQADQFYSSCTPAQRQAILLQLPKLTSQAQLQAFVEHLPSATL